MYELSLEEKRKYVTDAEEAEALAFVEAYHNRILEGNYIDTSGMPFEDFSELVPPNHKTENKEDVT